MTHFKGNGHKHLFSSSVHTFAADPVLHRCQQLLTKGSWVLRFEGFWSCAGRCLQGIMHVHF